MLIEKIRSVGTAARLVGLAVATAMLLTQTASQVVAEPDVKRITRTAADSKCIGNPITPECALDTWMACYAEL